MKFVVRENGRNTVKNLTSPRFVHHETHMEGPRRELVTPAVGGERLTACATRPPDISEKITVREISSIPTAVHISQSLQRSRLREARAE